MVHRRTDFLLPTTTTATTTATTMIIIITQLSSIGNQLDKKNHNCSARLIWNQWHQMRSTSSITSADHSASLSPISTPLAFPDGETAVIETYSIRVHMDERRLLSRLSTVAAVLLQPVAAVLLQPVAAVLLQPVAVISSRHSQISSLTSLKWSAIHSIEPAGMRVRYDEGGTSRWSDSVRQSTLLATFLLQRSRFCRMAPSTRSLKIIAER